MPWKYQNRSHEGPWVFKGYWDELYTQVYMDAANGDFDGDNLGDNLNPLALEARAFQSAKGYADYKAKRLLEKMKDAKGDLGDPNVLGVVQFNGKAHKPVAQTFVYKGSWKHEEFVNMEGKRGVRIDWVDPTPMIHKNIDRIEGDLVEALDFYANRWNRLVKVYPTVITVAGSASSININVNEGIPDDLGGAMSIGWVNAIRDNVVGTRCDNAAVDLYPEAAKWFVAIAQVRSWRRREGLGLRMYERLLDEVAKKGTPALVAPEECWVTGGTSDMAKGLWKAIYPRHNHIGKYILLGGDDREGKKQAAAKCDGMVERIVQRHLKRLSPKQRRDPNAVDEALDFALGEWDDVSGEVFNKAIQDMGLSDQDIAEGLMPRIAEGALRVAAQYMKKHGG